MPNPRNALSRSQSRDYKILFAKFILKRNSVNIMHISIRRVICITSHIHLLTSASAISPSHELPQPVVRGQSLTIDHDGHGGMRTLIATVILSRPTY